MSELKSEELNVLDFLQGSCNGITMVGVETKHPTANQMEMVLLIPESAESLFRLQTPDINFKSWKSTSL